MNKFLKYGLMAFTIANLACSSSNKNSTDSTKVATDSSEIIKAKLEAFEKYKETAQHLNELSVYSKYEQAADLSTYDLKNQGMFTIIKGDSANADFEIALPNPNAYVALMELAKTGYNIKEIGLEEVSFRKINNPKAFIATVTHKTKGDGKHEATNNFKTNKKELELYGKFGAFFNMAQEGGDRSDKNEFPRFATIENGNEKYNLTLEAGLGAAQEIATVNKKKIASISRINANDQSASANPWAYAIKVQ